MKLANMAIGARLWSAFGIVIALLVAIVIVALWRMNAAQVRVDNIVNDRYRKIALTTEVKYNVALIHLEVRTTNDGARRLYEGLGFTVAGRRLSYYTNGDDGYLMIKGL